WRERPGGYDIELALPQDFTVTALGVGARDLDAAGQSRTAGSLGRGGELRAVPLHGFRPALEPVLQALAPEGMRVRLADREGWVVARAGELGADDIEEDILPWRRAVYRTLL